jgi:oligoendopeptidase F
MNNHKTDEWDLESIFSSRAAWEDTFKNIEQEIPQLKKFQYATMNSAETLLNFIELFDALSIKADSLHLYAYLRHAENTRDQESESILVRANSLIARLHTEVSFFEPEFLACPSEVRSKIVKHPSLKTYRHRLKEIERYRPHTLTDPEEKLLGLLSPLRTHAERIRTNLHDAEMSFKPVVIEGTQFEVTHGSIEQLLSDKDRNLRKATYTSYTDAYLSQSQTHATAFVNHTEACFLFSKAKKFDSTFSKSLFDSGLTPELYHTVISSCKKHRNLFQRYFTARAKILGIEKIAEYDLHAPLSKNPPVYSYEQARELVLNSIHPLGNEYHSIARKGLHEGRWVDVYPRPGKSSNPFSAGGYQTKPFILLNYTPSILEVGTLAHELGHSMHSYYTSRSQPYCYTNYEMSVAETASNLNQVLLRDFILKHGDKEQTLAVLDEAFYFFHRYLFLMPTLSEIEYLLHDTCAKGGTMSADEISKVTIESFSEAYQDSVSFESRRLGVQWAKFCHFYIPFYFFQYAIGISAAMAIGKRIISNEKSIGKKYLQFLSAGASRPCTEIFAIADIDINDTAMYSESFEVVKEYVERIESLAIER